MRGVITFLPRLPVVCVCAALIACSAPAAVEPTSASAVEPTGALAPTATPTLAQAAAPTRTAAPSLTPDPFAPYYVESLRARSYGPGPIEIVDTLGRASSFTRYLIAYPSDGLRITGMMNVPDGEGPFPVIVLNHGYYDPAVYTTGRGTQAAADNFARRGYLTLAPDYRNYGGSDSGPNYFRVGYAVDVLNLIASVGSLSGARADRVGLWGHSMGGGVTIAVMVVGPPGVRGAVLYGAMSGDMRDNYYRIAYFRGADTPGPDWPVAPDAAPAMYARLSPINYLQYVGVPALIHHGDLDDQVPPAWSRRLAEALTAAGRQATLYTYPTAGHSFFDSDWNLFMRRNLEFFDEVLKSS